MKEVNNCFICTKTEDLATLKATDKRNYKEFTGYEIPKTEKLQMCAQCKENLQNSIKFLKLCKKVNQKFHKTFETIECHEAPSELTLTIHEENIDNENFISNDEATEVFKDQHEILEVIEIHNITEQDDNLTEDNVIIEFDDQVNKIYKCDTCGLTFKTSHKLKVHCLKHSAVKDWICGFDGCDKKFATEIRLKSHIRTHTKERPYICNWENCGMKFAQSNALLCHKRIHLNQKPYVCQICNKSFTQNTTLKTHMAAKHTGNQVQCDYPGCDKKFPRNSFLILHKKRDHENIRNYNCEECGKQYKQKSHLDRHVEASHKNIRHQCSYCEKSFSKSWSLKIHQFKHTEASNFPYKCTECGMNFPRRDIWIKHMSKVHPGVDVKRDAIEINVPLDIISETS